MGRARVGWDGPRRGGVRSGLQARPASGLLSPFHPSLCLVRTQRPLSTRSAPLPATKAPSSWLHILHPPLSPRLSAFLWQLLQPCAALPQLHPPQLRALGPWHAPLLLSFILSEATSLFPALLGSRLLFSMLSAGIPNLSVSQPFNIHFIYTLPSPCIYILSTLVFYLPHWID